VEEEKEDGRYPPHPQGIRSPSNFSATIAPITIGRIILLRLVTWWLKCADALSSSLSKASSSSLFILQALYHAPQSHIARRRYIGLGLLRAAQQRDSTTVLIDTVLRDKVISDMSLTAR